MSAFEQEMGLELGPERTQAMLLDLKSQGRLLDFRTPPALLSQTIFLDDHEGVDDGEAQDQNSAVNEPRDRGPLFEHAPEGGSGDHFGPVAAVGSRPQ